MDLIKLSKAELLAKCEELGIKKCVSKNKRALVELINAKTCNPGPVQVMSVTPPSVEDTLCESICYSTLSVSLTKTITSTEKKQHGIFFTPPSTIVRNIDRLHPYMGNITNVLEPSCGSCEYISILDKKYRLTITGIEIHKDIFDSIASFEKPNIHLHNADYLKYTPNCKYDLIIGNPPYFVMSKHEVDNSYYEYFDGRPNIFILFIIKSLRLLTPDGILSFILPKSFLNCVYYDKTRKYIIDHFKIIDIIECNVKYLETAQETIIMIIQNTMGGYHNDIFCLKQKFTINRVLYNKKFRIKTCVNSLRSTFLDPNLLSFYINPNLDNIPLFS